MRKRVHLLAAIATLGLTATGAYAMPVSPGALNTALDATNLVEKTAVYIVEGRRYCFYFNGWQGPGWYRCGFAWRRGLGWGGVYGWQGWEYGPAARRFSHREFRDGGRDRSDFRFREGRRDRDFKTGVTTREGTTRGETTIRSREGATMKQGAPGRSGDSFRSERSRGPSGGGFTEGRGSEFRGNAQMNASPPAARGGTEGRGGGAQMKSGGPGGGAQKGGPGGGSEGGKQ